MSEWRPVEVEGGVRRGCVWGVVSSHAASQVSRDPAKGRRTGQFAVRKLHPSWGVGDPGGGLKLAMSGLGPEPQVEARVPG